MVDKAAELHTDLESASVLMVNTKTFELEQYIEYRFEGEVMQYMYMGCDEGAGVAYYEYNNGTELNYITLPEETEWSFIAKGNEGYYSYSKAGRHYFADGKQLFNDFEAAVISSEITEHAGVDLKLIYDLNKLAEYSAFAEYGKFSDFNMTFHFNPEGYCTQIVNDYTLSDGESYGYKIDIYQRDSSEPIVRTDVDTLIAENRIF